MQFRNGQNTGTKRKLQRKGIAMNLYTFIIIIVFLSLVGLGVFYILYSREGKKAAKRAIGLLKEIDEKYEKFAGQHISIKVLRDRDDAIDSRRLNKELLVYLKPQVDALIAHVNATKIGSISIGYRSKYFPNLITLTEATFRSSQDNTSKKLLGHEENKFYEAIKDGVASDLAKRRLDADTSKMLGD